MRFIRTTLAAGAVLLCVVATVTLSQTAAQIERGTLRLHYVQKAIGFERYEIAPKGEGLALTSDFDFTDRGGGVPLGATLETRGDLKAALFRSKGRGFWVGYGWSVGWLVGGEAGGRGAGGRRGG